MKKEANEIIKDQEPCFSCVTRNIGPLRTKPLSPCDKCISPFERKQRDEWIAKSSEIMENVFGEENKIVWDAKQKNL